MTNDASPALEVALAYFQACAADKDLGRATDDVSG